jgi:hypothetical protein
MPEHRGNGGGQLEGARVFITTGIHVGQEGVCLGKTADGRAWAVTPDSSDEILELQFEKDFGLLVDLSSDPRQN